MDYFWLLALDRILRSGRCDRNGLGGRRRSPSALLLLRSGAPALGISRSLIMESKIKLLIVDDEVQFLDSIAQRLELRDFEVAKASRGEDAIAIARREKFDLALVDLKMPGIDGKQLLEKLKQEHNFLEVVILTGHGSLESAVECTKLGAFGYLPKPYELDDLIGVLKDAYAARLKKKFQTDRARIQKLTEIAMGSSPLGILRAMRELDDEEK
jgi:DNA-binding NtrC family response regulator